MKKYKTGFYSFAFILLFALFVHSAYAYENDWLIANDAFNETCAILKE